jgi:type IV pilus assembly protein PilZ
MLSVDKTSKRQKTNDRSCLSNSTTEKESAHNVLSIRIKEQAVLYSLYMPFLINGGIFIPTTKVYEISDEVFLLLKLIEEKEQIAVNAKVVWITPVQAQANRPAGIGLQFLENNSEAKIAIEGYLECMLKSNNPTLTL